MGVPTVGCHCPVCTSADPRDRRLRPSVMVRWMGNSGSGSLPSSRRQGPQRHGSVARDPGEAAKMGHGGSLADRERVVVIDTGPDFREQALRTDLVHIDAVLYTHSHADHILGLDDLRPLSFVSARAACGTIPLYTSPETASVLERIFEYHFSSLSTYPTRARVRLEPLASRIPVHEAEFICVPVRHGEMEIAGFRFGDAAYLTDVSEIPDSSFPLLEGLETLVLPALRHHPHPSHATVGQAVAWAERIGARQTWLTHIAHDLGHEETNRILPPGVALAYDGLEVAVNL
jgi:phosphoribosyl 1,2-cyclic phosphate phosphodiesterase